MESLENDPLIPGVRLYGNVKKVVNLEASSSGVMLTDQNGINGNALVVTAPHILTYKTTDECISDVDKCPSGFTFALWLKQPEDVDMTYLDSGALGSSSKGVTIKYSAT